MNRSFARRPGMLEAAIAGGITMLFALAVFVTYARFPVEELYHVSEEGLRGGAGRTLVFLNFPGAFIALALLPIAASSLLAAAWRRRAVVVATVAAAAFCLVAAAPGVVSQSDMDFKVINIVPVIGVVIALVLVGLAIRANGFGPIRPWERSDTVRAVFGGIFVIGGLPWIFGMAGVYIEDVPLLGRIFMSKGMVNGVEEIYVHPGDHHGFDGLLFLLTALLLARVIGAVTPRWLDRALSGFVAFMLVYGIANFLQDFWYEQAVRRGWSSYDIPNTTVPAATPVWGVILLGSVIAWLMLFHNPATRDRSRHRPVIIPS